MINQTFVENLYDLQELNVDDTLEEYVDNTLELKDDTLELEEYVNDTLELEEYADDTLELEKNNNSKIKHDLEFNSEHELEYDSESNIIDFIDNYYKENKIDLNQSSIYKKNIIPCKFFIKNKCNRKLCNYNHNIKLTDKDNKLIPCKFFIKNKCILNEYCKFYHDVSNYKTNIILKPKITLLPTQIVKSNNIKMCLRFKKFNNCYYGSKCEYKH